MLGNNERVVKALEKFDLPIYYAEVPDTELDNMNYFYYREVALNRNGTAHFVQVLEVAYVSVFQETLMEEDIIDSLEGAGLKFQSANYERIKLKETNNFVDIVVFTVTRPLKRKRCM